MASASRFPVAVDPGAKFRQCGATRFQPSGPNKFRPCGGAARFRESVPTRSWTSQKTTAVSHSVRMCPLPADRARQFCNWIFREFDKKQSVSKDTIIDFTNRFKARKDKQSAVEAFIRKVLEEPDRHTRHCGKIVTALLEAEVLSIPILVAAAANLLERADDLEFEYPEFWNSMSNLMFEWTLPYEDGELLNELKTMVRRVTQPKDCPVVLSQMKEPENESPPLPARKTKSSRATVSKERAHNQHADAQKTTNKIGFSKRIPKTCSMEQESAAASLRMGGRYQPGGNICESVPAKNDDVQTRCNVGASRGVEAEGISSEHPGWRTNRNFSKSLAGKDKGFGPFQSKRRHESYYFNNWKPVPTKNIVSEDDIIVGHPSTSSTWRMGSRPSEKNWRRGGTSDSNESSSVSSSKNSSGGNEGSKENPPPRDRKLHSELRAVEENEAMEFAICGRVQNLDLASSESSPQGASSSKNASSATSVSASNMSQLFTDRNRQFSKTIFEEFVNNQSIQDTIIDFGDRFKLEAEKQTAVEMFIEQVLEKPGYTRYCGEIVTALFEVQILSLPILVQAASSFMQMADDLTIDYPKFWDYMVNLLSEWPLPHEIRQLFNELKYLLQHLRGCSTVRSRVETIEQIESLAEKASQMVHVSSRPSVSPLPKHEAVWLSKIMFKKFVNSKDIIIDFKNHFQADEDRQVAVEVFMEQALKAPDYHTDHCGRIVTALLEEKMLSIPILVNAVSNLLKKADDLVNDYPEFWDNMDNILRKWPLLCTETLNF